MKLNLGCGLDVRTNYLNIDLEKTSPEVVQADFKNLANVVQDNLVDEILAINVIQYIRTTELDGVMSQWINKLSKGGRIFIESVDSKVFGTYCFYGWINIDQVNQILYPQEKYPPVAIYNLVELEDYLKNRFGLVTKMKNYKNAMFYIEMEKQ